MEGGPFVFLKRVEAVDTRYSRSKGASLVRTRFTCPQSSVEKLPTLLSVFLNESTILRVSVWWLLGKEKARGYGRGSNCGKTFLSDESLQTKKCQLNILPGIIFALRQFRVDAVPT